MGEGDVNIPFILGSTPEGEVLLDFRRHVDHLKLTREMALELAEGLVETVRDINATGRVILPDGSPFDV